MHSLNHTSYYSTKPQKINLRFLYFRIFVKSNVSVGKNCPLGDVPIHLLFIIGISILLNLEVFAAIRGEIKISARLMPFERATQTLFGIVHTPNEAADLGTVAVPRLVIHRADRKIARAGEVAEKASARCCDNATVVLCHNVRDH